MEISGRKQIVSKWIDGREGMERSLIDVGILIWLMYRCRTYTHHSLFEAADLWRPSPSVRTRQKAVIDPPHHRLPGQAENVPWEWYDDQVSHWVSMRGIRRSAIIGSSRHLYLACVSNDPLSLAAQATSRNLDRGQPCAQPAG